MLRYFEQPSQTVSVTVNMTRTVLSSPQFYPAEIRVSIMPKILTPLNTFARVNPRSTRRRAVFFGEG